MEFQPLEALVAELETRTDRADLAEAADLADRFAEVAWQQTFAGVIRAGVRAFATTGRWQGLARWLRHPAWFNDPARVLFVCRGHAEIRAMLQEHRDDSDFGYWGSIAWMESNPDDALNALVADLAAGDLHRVGTRLSGLRNIAEVTTSDRWTTVLEQIAERPTRGDPHATEDQVVAHARALLAAQRKYP